MGGVVRPIDYFFFYHNEILSFGKPKSLSKSVVDKLLLVSPAVKLSDFLTYNL